MSESIQAELLRLNQQLLDCIAAGDWETYEHLCDASLTCLEPEARGQIVAGLPFHKFYFDLGGGGSPVTTTMASPHVRLMGDAAVVCYVRLVQKLDPVSGPVVRATEETRVWQKIDGRWRHVHFHRSVL